MMDPHNQKFVWMALIVDAERRNARLSTIAPDRKRETSKPKRGCPPRTHHQLPCQPLKGEPRSSMVTLENSSAVDH